MRQYHIYKLTTLLILSLVFHFTLMAQKVTEEKLLGCWKIKSIEFLQHIDDSSEIVNSTKGMITCFEKNGKFSARLKTENSDQLIGTGTFNIGPDGKTINQKRDADDGGIDLPAEVSIINEQEITLKVEQLILHYERLPN